MLESLFQRLHCLRRAIARRRDTIDLRRAILVKAQGEFRSVDVFDRGQGIEWNRVIVRIPNIELTYILGIIAVIAFCFDIGLPSAPEPVEVVDELTTHEGL